MQWRPPTSDLTDTEAAALWAASGAQWLTDRGVTVPGSLVRRFVGLVDELDRRGAGLADIVDARGLGLLAERAAAMGLPPSSRTSCGGATRLLPTIGDWIALSLARPDDLSALPALLDGAVAAGPGDHEVSDALWSEIERAVAGLDPTALVERAQLLGMACSVVGEVTDDRAALLERLGDAEPTALDGAVVVDLASLWAGPLCGDILARFGARVIKVESSRRPDGGRRAGRFFAALHGRCESVALDLTTSEGRSSLDALLRRADVVIEGSRPRALEQMGIDARRIAAHGPRIWLSITSHGRTAPASARVGFGDDAAAAGGLVGWVESEPRFLADAVADPITGLVSACVVADLVARGGRWLVDVALARVAASAVGGWVPRSVAEVQRPRVRRDPGGPLPLGRDNHTVLP